MRTFCERLTTSQVNGVARPFRYCGRTDCGCSYQMTVSLLDENHEVIQEFKPDPVTLDPDCDDCSWRQVRRERRPPHSTGTNL